MTPKTRLRDGYSSVLEIEDALLTQDARQDGVQSLATFLKKTNQIGCTMNFQGLTF
jgi:hypothetical protein